MAKNDWWLCSERLLWCRRLTWGPHCQDITEANRLVRLFVTWELSFYVCLLKLFFKNLLVCHMASWIFVCTKPEEGKQTPETTNTKKKKKSKMQLCHSNFSFVSGLSWTIKIIMTKASTRWKLAHSTPKNPAWIICRKFEDRTAGMAWEYLLVFCACLIFIQFLFVFFILRVISCMWHLGLAAGPDLKEILYQWEITGVLIP